MYYQVTNYYDSVGQKKIASKCPGCGTTNCLELFFYQKRIETPFSKKTTKKVTGILLCHHTNTEISPVLWTDEIENYFKTEKGKLKLQPSNLKLTKWFYFIVIFPFLIVTSAIGYSIYEEQKYADQSKALEFIATGDKVKVLYSLIEDNSITQNGTTWFIVRKINGDSIWLQRHVKFQIDDESNFNLKDSKFTEETIKASVQQFKTRGLFGHDYTNQKFSGFITEIEK